MINKKIGSIRTEESKRKQGSSILGQKNHMYGKTGNLAKNAKKYVVTYPDKKTEIIFNMYEFCKTNGLYSGAMSRIAQGKQSHHKGFKCEYYQDWYNFLFL